MRCCFNFPCVWYSLRQAPHGGVANKMTYSVHKAMGATHVGTFACSGAKGFLANHAAKMRRQALRQVQPAWNGDVQ